jgi:hypothetical protein
MSEDAILWKLGFGAVVLAVSLLSLLTRTPPETVLEPVVVSPRMLPAGPIQPRIPVTASLAPNESLVDAAEAAPHREPSQPAAAVVAKPQAQTRAATRAATRHRPAPPASVVAVRAPRGAIVRTAARARVVRPHSPYTSGRQHYPFDPRHRWSGEQAP